MNKKTKILIVSQHFWPETFRVTDICEGLVERGYEVDVLCGIPNYPAGKFYKGYGLTKNRRQNYKGINIIRVPEVPRGSNSNFRIFANFISFPFFALFYLPRLIKNDYDRILVYQLSPVFMALPAILLGKITKIKLYFYVLDFWPHSLFSILTIKNRIMRWLLTEISYWHYKQPDGLIGAFKGTQTRLVSYLGIPKEKTIYIPQAAEKIYEKEIYDQELFARFDGKYNVIFAGSINPAQSFETILGAAKKIKDSGYKNVNYIILGDGMSKKWVVEEVERLDLKDCFTFEGLVPIEEVPKYQTLADTLIVALSRSPLFEYGVPAKVQSYMASGKPIVGAMDGEGKRLINESGCGICVASGDIDGLFMALKKLIDMSKKERIEMGGKGREYHFKHYDRDVNLHRLIDFVFNNKRMPDNEYPD